MAIDKIGTNGLVASAIVPPDGSITSAKIADDAVTGAKLATPSLLDASTLTLSVAGNIYAGIASNLTITTNTAGSVSVIYKEGSTTVATTSSVAITNGTAVTAVPSAVYGQTAGDTITITITNADSLTSNAVTETVLNAPTGGTITTSGIYRIHTFNSSGTFATQGYAGNVEYLCIAGGGGGGQQHGGGGGAGGYRTNVVGQQNGGNNALDPAYAVTAGQSITVTIGAGGAAATGGGTRGSVGVNSVFGTITSIGGGAGGGWAGAGYYNGSLGGSGGGTSLKGEGGLSTDFGHTGAGMGDNPLNHPVGGGGGGGAGDAGRGDMSITGGGVKIRGGNGLFSNITGSSVQRGGGGGGASHSPHAAGLAGAGGGGIGGLGNAGAGASGTANTGGGGGGSGGNNVQAGAGGSGVVIIRYEV